MAKDKSKSKGGSAADEEFGNPSEAPAGGDGFEFTKEGRNKLILFTPLREEERPAFDKKAAAKGVTQPVIICDLIVIDEKDPSMSVEHENVWIFQRYVQGSLRGFIDVRKVLGRLRNTEDTSKATSASGGYYWELEDASKKDIEKARAAVAALNDPFRSKKKAAESKPAKSDKGGKRSKPAPEPEKKKGKGKKK